MQAVKSVDCAVHNCFAERWREEYHLFCLGASHVCICEQLGCRRRGQLELGSGEEGRCRIAPVPVRLFSPTGARSACMFKKPLFSPSLATPCGISHTYLHPNAQEERGVLGGGGEVRAVGVVMALEGLLFYSFHTCAASEPYATAFSTSSGASLIASLSSCLALLASPSLALPSPRLFLSLTIDPSAVATSALVGSAS